MIHILAVSDQEISGRSLPNFHPVDMLVNCGDISPSYTEVLIFKFRPIHRIMTYGNHDKAFFHTQIPTEKGYCRVYKGMYVLTQGIHRFKRKGTTVSVGGFSGAPAYGHRPFFFSDSHIKSYLRKLKIINFFKPYSIDIMLSHCAPNFEGVRSNPGHFHKPSSHLAGLASILKPKIWFYGHIHPTYTREPLDFYFSKDNLYLINAIPYVYLAYDPESGTVHIKAPKKKIARL